MAVSEGVRVSIIAGLAAVVGGLVGAGISGYFAVTAVKETARSQNSLALAQTNKEKSVPFFSALRVMNRVALISGATLKDFEAAWVGLDSAAGMLEPYLDYGQAMKMEKIVRGYRSFFDLEEPELRDKARIELVSDISEFMLEFHVSNERLAFNAQASPEELIEDQKINKSLLQKQFNGELKFQTEDDKSSSN
ncbi:hypothetical protein [Pseudomonas synxantha]|uniref:hypothetical protein n=1 Tax=Pseudomonas synxantha TaxID=47883 RepID=UPI000A98E7EB|nr:hypothetical protein [Pseudomonas synxantha]